jgi:hypothetical protein
MSSRSRSDIAVTVAGEFSSTRAETPFSALVDGGVQSGDLTIADIDSENYCLFVGGRWNCAGELCSIRSHRVS